MRNLRAHVLTCLACSRSYVPTCLECLRTHVQTCLGCLRAHVPCMPTCQCALRVYVLMCQRAYLACSRAHVLTCFLALFLSFPYEIKLCMKNARKTCRCDTTMSLDTFILNIQLYTPAIKWLDFCLSANLRVIFKSSINSGRWIVTSLS